MNETLQTMLTRRSTRQYRPDPVPRELIDQILQAGLYAPSARGNQSTILLAVTNKDLRDRLSRMNAQVNCAQGDPFYGAPVVLVVLADRSLPNWQYDGPIVMENLMLAAHSLGLGSCWIHRAKEVFQSPEGQEILRTLGVTGDYEGVGHCVIGWPEGPAPEPRPRREGRIFRID